MNQQNHCNNFDKAKYLFLTAGSGLSGIIMEDVEQRIPELLQDVAINESALESYEQENFETAKEMIIDNGSINLS